jgi:hypothetical protein
LVLPVGQSYEVRNQVAELVRIDNEIGVLKYGLLEVWSCSWVVEVEVFWYLQIPSFVKEELSLQLQSYNLCALTTKGNEGYNDPAFLIYDVKSKVLKQFTVIYF